MIQAHTFHSWMMDGDVNVYNDHDNDIDDQEENDDDCVTFSLDLIYSG